MLGRLSRFLFGYDFFISYAYKDGRDYAGELEKQLSNLDFACFFDASELPPGEGLPSSLRRAIGRSKAFVLVGTEASITAPYVNLELSTALEGKKIIPIDVDGIRERVSSEALRELPWVNEDGEAGKTAGPSATVLERISGYVQFTRRNTITRRAVSAVAVVFLIVALVAVWQWRLAVERQRIAIFQRDLALSRQLAGQSSSVLEAKPDLGLLLAAEAARRSVTFEARDALLRALQRHPNLVTLLHDAGQVRHLAFSPDGAVLASASSAGEVALWDVETGARRISLPIPGATPARRLGFHRDGRLLAAYGADAPLAVWDLSGDASRPLTDASVALDIVAAAGPGEGDSVVATLAADIETRGFTVRSAALSHDPRILATTDGEEIRLWTSMDGAPFGQPLSAQERYVRALAFAPSGLLASGSSAGTVALWNLGDRLLIGQRLDGLDISANSLAFSPDEKLLAGGDYNGRIVLWELRTGQPSQRHTLDHGSNVHALRFGPDGRTLASYGPPRITLWDLETGQRIRDISMNLALGSAVAIGPDLARAALGGNAGELVLYELATGEPLGPVSDEHGDRLLALAFSADGRSLASAGNGRRIFLRNLETGESTGPLEGHTAPVVDLEFSADGRRLASYDSDGTLVVWDLDTLESVGRPLRREEAYSASSAMALSPDGRIAVTSGPDGALSLWDVETWRPLGEPLSGHPGLVNVIEFSPKGNWMASGGRGGAVLLWDLRIESWRERACGVANRGLSPREKAAYLIVPEEDEPGGCDIR